VWIGHPNLIPRCAPGSAACASKWPIASGEFFFHAMFAPSRGLERILLCDLGQSKFLHASRNDWSEPHRSGISESAGRASRRKSILCFVEPSPVARSVRISPTTLQNL
jgi:hypothetical protein